MIPKEDSIEPIKATSSAVSSAVAASTTASSSSSASSSSASNQSSGSSSSSSSSSDDVNLSSQAQKAAERQRLEEERQEALRQIEEERKAREKALEEERIAKEKAIEEERQAKLKALEEETKRKEEALKAQQLKDQERAAKEAALKAEVEAKKKAIEEEAAAKKQALEAEISEKKNALVKDVTGKTTAVETEYQNKLTALEGPTMPPNFNDMTPEEQYNYLHDVFVAMAGGDESQWLTGDKEVNLIGIRSWQNGQAGSAEGNKYNDTIYAVRMVDGKPEIYAFTATVDAGIDPGGTKWGYTADDGRHGYSHVADGFYGLGTFTETGGGHWGVQTVLAQSGNVKINADFNNDGVIQDDERIGVTEGAGWGIFFHPGGSGENVYSSSAGCQAIRPEQYGLFQQLLQQSPNSKYAYALVDSSNLPQVNADHVAVGVPNTPVATGTGGYSGSAGSSTSSGTAGSGTSGYNPVIGSPSVGSIPLPANYTPPTGANPFGAANPFNPIKLDQQNADQQLMSLCMEALQEINAMKNQSSPDQQTQGVPAAAGKTAGLQSQGIVAMGPATMTLYATYAQALMDKIKLQPQTEQMVSTTLAMVGIDTEQLKQLVGAQDALTGNASKTTAPTASAGTGTGTSATPAAASTAPAATVQEQQQLNM